LYSKSLLKKGKREKKKKTIAAQVFKAQPI